MTDNPTPLSNSELELLKSSISAELKANPPTIGVIGVSGVGKSSTINSLFKVDLPTSDTIRCTTEFEAISAKVTACTTEGSLVSAELKVYDAPGLGEDIDKDDEYLEMYKHYLPNCDVILWVMTARNRAVALDQQYLSRLADFKDKFVFAINQIDLTEPINWHPRKDVFILSTDQKKNLEKICKDRARRISSVIGFEPQIVAYGAKQNFRLPELLRHIVDRTDENRKWVFNALKKVTAADLIDGLTPRERKKVERELQKIKNTKTKSKGIFQRLKLRNASDK